MYATGGGAHKYADMFRDHLGVDLFEQTAVQLFVGFSSW